MDIPLDYSQPVKQQLYLIQSDDITPISVPITDMPLFIPKPTFPLYTATKNDHLLSDFLQLKKKITYKHEGQYYQGCISQSDSIYWFVYKRHPSVKLDKCGIPLPDLTHNWSSLCVECVLLSGHNVSTFLQTPDSSNFDPVANIVSVINPNKDCSSSLLQAPLALAHPDREVWLQSYYEEKNSIESMGTFTKLSLGKYRAMCKNSAPKLSLQCVSLPSTRMRTSCHSALSLKSMFSAITKSMFGQSRNDMPPCSGRNSSIFSSVRLLRNVVPSSKGMLRMPLFVMVISPLTK